MRGRQLPASATELSAAIHHVVVSHLATDSRTKEYAARRTAQGKTKKEIMRWLKRYVARELYRQLTNPQTAPSITDLRASRQEIHITLRATAGHLPPGPAHWHESNEDSAETITSLPNFETGFTSKKKPRTLIDN